MSVSRSGPSFTLRHRSSRPSRSATVTVLGRGSSPCRPFPGFCPTFARRASPPSFLSTRHYRSGCWPLPAGAGPATLWGPLIVGVQTHIVQIARLLRHAEPWGSTFLMLCTYVHLRNTHVTVTAGEDHQPGLSSSMSGAASQG